MCQIVVTKVCSKCKVERTLIEFGRDKRSKDGLNSYCKSCVRIMSKKYRDDNPEIVRANARKWQSKNKEWKRTYYRNNSEKILQQNKLTQDEFKRKEYIKQYKLSRKNNPKLHMEDKIKKNIFMAIYHFTGQNKKWIGKNTKDILGCDLNFFLNYIESKFQKGMSFKNHGQYGWHLDHIVPISSATSVQDIIKLNHYTNFQPLWAKDNLSKSNKISEEWGNA